MKNNWEGNIIYRPFKFNFLKNYFLKFLKGEQRLKTSFVNKSKVLKKKVYFKAIQTLDIRKCNVINKRLSEFVFIP